MNQKPKNINTLISLISQIKEREVRLYEEKIIYLKYLMRTHPENKVYAHRYQLTRIRFENLIETTKRLKYLEIDSKNKN
ncbi:hypothetical protein WJN01_12850 [Flavobacteriaceae bacterium SZ-1-7]